MDRLAQLVDAELLDAEQDDGVGAGGNRARTHRPARRLVGAGIAAPREDAERPLHQGVGQMHEQRILPGTEHAQRAEPLDERLRTEGEPRHRPVSAGGRRAAHRLVDDVAPAREIGVKHAGKAGLRIGPELRAAGGNGEGGFECIAQGGGVEIDFTGHGLYHRCLARLRIRRCNRRVRCEVCAAAAARGVPIEIRPHRCRVLAPNQAAVHRAVEDLVERAEILAHPVRLAYHVIEKVQIGIGRAREVMHRHVAGLPVAVDASVALLQARRIPGAVVVKQVAGSAVQVEPFGRGVRGDEHPHRRRRIVERGLDVLPVALVHAAGAAAAEQREDAIIGVAFPEAAGQVVEGGLVLREDDQAFVGPERRFVPRPAAGTIRGLDQQSGRRASRARRTAHRPRASAP